ncbi:MAG: polyphosphate kinase 2 [Burkholderiaceae bacterium]|nr:polyphosphate kinase 2 [Burkholderiales bacterium]MCZ8105266.1 polyphosphate kinase 2 [Burkholderiales bacterium]MCZ8337255.1 polyphosphate kinase 2 [Burkholderiaceae bacterium]
MARPDIELDIGEVVRRLEVDPVDAYDEEYELEFEDRHLDRAVERSDADEAAFRLQRRACSSGLFRPQSELVKLQDWIAHTGEKVVIVFEGRDAAGGMGLFDRSGYDRAGVERMIVRSGIRLIKYWFAIPDEEQDVRFLGRIHDPLKQSTLGPMDLESRRRSEDHTRAKEAMLERTHIAEAPWWVVAADDKKRARLNCNAHLLTLMPYREVVRPHVELPQRMRHPDYSRRPTSAESFVPERH